MLVIFLGVFILDIQVFFTIKNKFDQFNPQIFFLLIVGVSLLFLSDITISEIIQDKKYTKNYKKIFIDFKKTIQDKETIYDIYINKINLTYFVIGKIIQSTKDNGDNLLKLFLEINYINIGTNKNYYNDDDLLKDQKDNIDKIYQQNQKKYIF